MRVRRLPGGLIVPVLLMGLVGLLATLQYRWLGQVSEAEREQLRRSLGQRAREFADDFDREISRAYLTLQLSRDAMAARDWSPFATAFDQWRATARFPQMIRAVCLAESVGGLQTLRRYDHAARVFADAPLPGWPSHLEPVRRQLAVPFVPLPLPASAGQPARTVSTPGGTAQFYAVAMMAANVDVPALLIPVLPTGASWTPAAAASADAATTSTATWLRHETAYVLVELDGDYLRQTVLPALAARHFPENGSDRYQVAVVSGDGSRVFARNIPDGVSIDVDTADIVTPFFAVRFDLAGSVEQRQVLHDMALRSPASEAGDSHAEAPAGADRAVSVIIQQGSAAAARDRGGTASGQTRMRFERRTWRVVLRHGAGSLDAAVSQTRRRNLWLSFGILAVLSAGVVLVIVNARRAEQLAVRQMDFVATVSHELRTPLAVIRSAAQNLSAGVVSDAGQTRRYGELIDGEGRRLSDMVEQVLDYAGLVGSRSFRPSQTVDVGTLVDDVIASHGAAIRAAGVTAVVETENDGSELPPVRADEEALRRALDNLVTNALKHGADGRWLGVTVRAGSARGRREIEVVVCDRGRGIEASDVDHVFEPFYRGRHAVDRQIHGNGLGLSLVKRIVEAHGGRISVRSVPGEGAAFTVHLPTSQPGAPA